MTEPSAVGGAGSPVRRDHVLLDDSPEDAPDDEPDDEPDEAAVRTRRDRTRRDRTRRDVDAGQPVAMPHPGAGP